MRRKYSKKEGGREGEGEKERGRKKSKDGIKWRGRLDMGKVRKT